MFRLWNSFNPPASSSCASTHSLPTSDETRLPVQSVSDQPFSLPVSMENSPGMMLLKTFKLQIVINSFTIFTDSISLRWTILLLFSALFLQWSIIVTRSKKILSPPPPNNPVSSAQTIILYALTHFWSCFVMTNCDAGSIQNGSLLKI